jgi:hypothetical protein
MLMERQRLLSTGLRELYRKLKACGGWEGPLPSEFDSGDPNIHSLLHTLGVLDEYDGEDKDLVAVSFKLVPEADEVEAEVEVEAFVNSPLVAILDPGMETSGMQTRYPCDFNSSTFGQHLPLSDPAGEKSNPIGYIHSGHEEVIIEHDWDWSLPSFLQLPDPEIQEPALLDCFRFELGQAPNPSQAVNRSYPEMEGLVNTFLGQPAWQYPGE